jgi:hypothetical protein
MATKYGSLPFNAQIAFFRKKLALPTRSWTDIWQANHDHAFVVAGATKMELVEDLQGAVQKAIEEGTTIQQFRKDFDQIVQKHGWSYKGGRGWRTRVIYDTNLRSSYAAGRFEQLQNMEFWQYHHSAASEDPRPEHLSWDGLILPKDDKFWQTHFPMNGWGCKCWVTGLSKQRMKAKGLKPSQSPKTKMERKTVGTRGPSPRTVDVPKGIDPGFAYAPGRSAWTHAHVPRARGDAPWPYSKHAQAWDDGTPRPRIIPDVAARELMPDPRPFPKDRLLQSGLDEEAYVKTFLDEFGATMETPAMFKDVTGDSLLIGKEMFWNEARGTWKATKRGRETLLKMLADTIKDPDEVWVSMEWHHNKQRAVVRRRYLARFNLSDGTRPGFAVFETGSDGWFGVTTYPRDFPTVDELDAEINKVRRGVRLFRRQG